MQPYISRVLNVHIRIQQNLKLSLEKSDTNKTDDDRRTPLTRWDK